MKEHERGIGKQSLRDRIFMTEDFIPSNLELLCNDIDALDEPEWKKEKLKKIAKHLLTTPEGQEQIKKLREQLTVN